MIGKDSLFSRSDSIEAAWAVVDPVLVEHEKALPYQPGSWGPHEADKLIANDGNWNHLQIKI